MRHLCLLARIKPDEAYTPCRKWIAAACRLPLATQAHAAADSDDAPRATLES
jgi:hypothetical protein